MIRVWALLKQVGIVAYILFMCWGLFCLGIIIKVEVTGYLENRWTPLFNKRPFHSVDKPNIIVDCNFEGIDPNSKIKWERP